MPTVNPAPPFLVRQRPHPLPTRVVIEGSEAMTTSPEGVVARMPLPRLLQQLTGNRPSTGDLILPDGVKAVIPHGSITVFAWESPPRLHSLTWIAKDSPAPFGSSAKYRPVRVALPYLIILAVFEADGAGQLHLSEQSECFFRNAPLKSVQDELHYPAFLNCYSFGPGGSKPLSWICTAGLRRTAAMYSPNVNDRVRASLDVIRQYLLETGFNHSDGQGGQRSWFAKSRSVDPRLATIEAWEEASAKDPLFVLDVPWLPTGLTLGQVSERIAHHHQEAEAQGITAATLARILFNQP